MFGSKEKETEIEAKKSKDKIEAELMKSKVLAEQHERLVKFIEENKADCESYEFRCERYGDFLAIFTKRGKEEPRNSWYYQPHKQVVAISLINNKSIQLNNGHAPDTSATAKFFVDQRMNKDNKYESYVDYCYNPYSHSRSMVVTDIQQQNGGGMMVYGWPRKEYLGVNLEQCACMALDDSIRFEGSGVTIYAPFGKGQEVYDKILEAMKTQMNN